MSISRTIGNHLTHSGGDRPSIAWHQVPPAQRGHPDLSACSAVETGNRSQCSDPDPCPGVVAPRYAPERAFSNLETAFASLPWSVVGPRGRVATELRSPRACSLCAARIQRTRSVGGWSAGSSAGWFLGGSTATNPWTHRIAAPRRRRRFERRYRRSIAADRAQLQVSTYLHTHTIDFKLTLTCTISNI
jgi:hypothetical protein